MNRRFGPGTIAITLLVLLADCSAPLQTTDGGDTLAESQRTISTSGSGDVSADADRTIVTGSVTARADSAEAARESVATNVSAMRGALHEAGVDDGAVTTAAYHVRAVSDVDRTTERREIVGYEAVHAFRIETTPGAAGTVVDTAVGNGASEIRSVQFTLTDETPPNSAKRRSNAR